MAQTLTSEQIKSFTSEHPQWSLRDGKLVREWIFPDFAGAILFVNRVASVAERAHHHPDIDIRYSRVVLTLVSHDAGGITPRDTGLARELDAIVP